MKGHLFRRRRVCTNGYASSAAQLILAVLAGLCMACLVIASFNARVRPQVVSLAQAQMEDQLTRMADQAVLAVLLEDPLSDSGLVSVHTLNGQVTALTADTARMNLLRARIMEELLKRLAELDGHTLFIPVGALTGLDVLSGLGPDLPVQILSVASADAVYESTFTDAGVNQTLHRIFLNVTLYAKLVLPGGVAQAQARVPLCVAETVIVGQTPDTYLNWNP